VIDHRKYRGPDPLWLCGIAPGFAARSLVRIQNGSLRRVSSHIYSDARRFRRFPQRVGARSGRRFGNDSPLVGLDVVGANSWGTCRWHRRFFWLGYFAFWFGQLFVLFAEFFFFEEFKSRFNTVAVDYIWYPHEVFTNIWESYHVGIVLAICLGLSLAWVLILGRLFRRMWERPFSAAARVAYLVAGLALLALLTPTLNLKGAHVSTIAR